MKKIILIAASLSLIGCATITLKEADKLVYGMTKQQVISYLGEPESRTKSGDVEYLYYRLPVNYISRTRYDYYVKLKKRKVIAFGHHIQSVEPEE